MSARPRPRHRGSNLRLGQGIRSFQNAFASMGCKHLYPAKVVHPLPVLFRHPPARSGEASKAEITPFWGKVRQQTVPTSLGPWGSGPVQVTGKRAPILEIPEKSCYFKEGGKGAEGI